MTYTDEKVNLVINKMTQAQYEQAKSEGILKDNELYIVPDNAPVDVPTKLSELENDVGYLDAGDKTNIQNDYNTKIDDAKYLLEFQMNYKADKDEVPTKTSQLTNDSGFIGGEEAQALKVDVAGAMSTAQSAVSEVESVNDRIDNILSMELPSTYATKEEMVNADNELSERIDLIEATSHPNMNVIGSPTFSQGSVGGFSDEDYLMFPTSVNVGNNSVDFHMTFTTGDDVSTQQNILDSWCGLALAIENGHFILAASSNGTTFEVAEGGEDVEANTPYDIKVSFRYEDGTYTVELGVGDGISYSQEAKIWMNAPLFATPTYWGGANPSSGISHIFGGTINLNKCWMVWNEEVIWRGYSELPIPTKVSQLENDSGYVTSGDLPDVSDVVRKVVDTSGNKTAVTIGTRLADAGENSLVVGVQCQATERGCLAQGWQSKAYGRYSIALGNSSSSNHLRSFTWTGPEGYESHGESTFNINPLNGTNGFYIGDKNLTTILSDKVSSIPTTTMSGEYEDGSEFSFSVLIKE